MIATNFFKNFFKNLLTVYQRENDTYKNGSGEGLFERYMALFGESVDNEQASQIDNYLDIIDAGICDEKFLTHISDVLGNPPDIFLNNDQYRNLLLYITNVYKVKGTSRGYLLFFYILGYNVTVLEIEPNNFPNRYDTSKEYDDEDYTYDMETCQACSVYNLRVEKIGEEDFELDSNLLDRMSDAIKFNEPINAILGNFTIVINVFDSIDILITDDAQPQEVDYHFYYDSPLEYDMDEPIIPPYDDDLEEEV